MVKNIQQLSQWAVVHDVTNLGYGLVEWTRVLVKWMGDHMVGGEQLASASCKSVCGQAFVAGVVDDHNHLSDGPQQLRWPCS